MNFELKLSFVFFGLLSKSRSPRKLILRALFDAKRTLPFACVSFRCSVSVHVCCGFADVARSDYASTSLAGRIS